MGRSKVASDELHKPWHRYKVSSNGSGFVQIFLWQPDSSVKKQQRLNTFFFNSSKENHQHQQWIDPTNISCVAEKNPQNFNQTHPVWDDITQVPKLLPHAASQMPLMQHSFSHYCSLRFFIYELSLLMDQQVPAKQVKESECSEFPKQLVALIDCKCWITVITVWIFKFLMINCSCILNQLLMLHSSSAIKNCWNCNTQLLQKITGPVMSETANQNLELISPVCEFNCARLASPFV